LFGARGTGKSTFVKSQIITKNSLYLDLLDPDLEEQFSKKPDRLLELVKKNIKKVDWFVLDEIQKVPKLLDLVHKSIEEHKVKFILTGSSARKLRRGGANLLAGRAFLYSMFPLTKMELKDQFDLDFVLRWGGLPKIYSLELESDKIKFLKTYGQIYLKEEIKEEQIIRNIDPFREFLSVSAQMSGKIINYSKIGNDVGVEHKTVQNYFQVLEDTWIGFFLPSFHQSIRKSQKLSPKFYYFDLGVRNSLAQVIESKPTSGNSFYGELFEHFMINEVFRCNEYLAKDYRLSYLATKNNAEIDLILSKGRIHYAIEFKSTDKINETDVRKLAALAQDIPNMKKIYYVSKDPQARTINDVECLPWDEFLDLFISKSF
jgi:uncharacterized protein